MKVITAIDSFKGSLSSMEAGAAAREGILRVFPQAEVWIRPLADGGEGTVDALTEGLQGRKVQVTVPDPLGRPVVCTYGILEESRTAILEMSGAAGLTLLSPEERNPLKTGTYGVGMVIRDAIERGCRRFLVGIGGSATNDGGVGMLQALGYEFLDSEGNPIPPGAEGLKRLASIGIDHVMPELEQCRFQVACDVKNVLCGSEGCSAVYGPQKGADPEMIRHMDGWLKQYAELTRKVSPQADPEFPGTGAAGGMGFAFLSYTNAVLESGIHIVLEETKLEAYIKEADVILTGEGRLDGQTAMGKAPIGVAELAKKYGKTVLAFAGGVTEDAKACNEKGIDAFFPIVRGITTLEQAMETKKAEENLADTVEQVFRLIKALEK